MRLVRFAILSVKKVKHALTSGRDKQTKHNKKHMTHLTCPAPGPKHDFQGRCDYLVHVALLQEKGRKFIVIFINN